MINPIIFRLGVTKDWFTKFINTKVIDLANFIYNTIEIVNFIHLYFNKYRLYVSKFCLYNNKYDLKLFIVYGLQTVVYKQNNSLMALNKINLLVYHFITINNYLKFQYLLALYININSKILSISKYLFFNRLNIFKLIYLLKFKYLNFKQIGFINLIINKFIAILRLFLNYKVSILVIFKQLAKNIKLKTFLAINKYQLILNILKLRKFDQLEFFRLILNLIYNSILLKSKVILISDILRLKLPNIKRSINLFIKYIENLLLLFLFKSNIIVGLKLILKGNIIKNKRAIKMIVNIGHFINNSRISNDIIYHKSTCFTVKGTFGIKIFIQH